jgi:hypothetical protein
LHHKLCSEQHLFQIAVIPASGEAFRLHPHPLALLVLQQAQGHPANDGEVGVGCGDCLPACIQEIDIPNRLRDVHWMLG